MILRRTFLRGAAALPALVVLPPALRRPDERLRRLVVVQLRGGNDGLNTVVPRRDPRYEALRPVLALPRRNLLGLDADNAFHPNLKRLASWYERGRLAVVHGVGYPHQNLSHFCSQDVWDAARTDESRPTEGWLGRWALQAWAAAGEPGDPPPALVLACGGEVPLALRTARWLPPAVAELEGFRLQAGGSDGGRGRVEAIAALHAGGDDDPDLARVHRTVRAALDVGQRLERLRGPRAARYPGSDLGRALELVGRGIAGGLDARVYHAVLDGFDTHTRQLEEHGRLLTTLDAALDALLSDLEAQGELERTLVLTVSEFGRRPAESGIGSAAGSDHGAASLLFLAGGTVRPGLHGNQPDLEALDPIGNPRHDVDFRRVYATVVEGWLGGDAESVLGRRFETLPLLEA